MKLIFKNRQLTCFVGTILILTVSLIFAYFKSLVPFEMHSTANDINENIKINPYLLLLPLLFSPVVEELIFRKWIPAAFQDELGRGKVIVLSNILFACFHLDPFFIPYLANGLIYSWYYEKTGDLKIPIAIHIFYNLLVFILINIQLS